MFAWHKFLLDQFVGLLLSFFLISSGLHNPLACTLYLFFTFRCGHINPLAHWALLFPLGSHSPFTLLLPLMCLWAYQLSFLTLLPHWSFTSFLRLLWPICFTFTSCFAHRPTGHHFLPCRPIWLLPLLLGSCGPFASIMFLSSFSSFIFFHYWAFFAVGSFVKKWVSTTVYRNIYICNVPALK